MIEPRQIKLPAQDENARISVIEALLFAAAEPVEIRHLAQVLKWTMQETEAAVNELDRQLLESHRGIRLQHHDGAVQLVSAPEYGLLVRNLLEIERTVRLSTAALETLAIIAYQQPVTRAEVESLRGVDSSGVLGTLVSRELIEIAGRRQAPGNPNEYVTTDVFLRYFGLSSIDEIPEPPD